MRPSRCSPIRMPEKRCCWSRMRTTCSSSMTEELLALTSTVASVDALPDEKAELEFVTKFRACCA